MLNVLRGMLLVFGISASLLASAQEQKPANPAPVAKAAFEAGVDYTVISVPVKTSDPTTIEVDEVFWYGCSHCYDFDPMISVWAKKLPADVAFVRTPVIWNEFPTRIHAKLYYTALQLKILDKAHPAIFTAINQGKKKLDKEPDIVEFLQQFGVSAADVSSTLNSFSSDSLARMAEARVKNAGITGTPQIIVNGKYVVGGEKSGSQANMLKIVDFLIQQERAAHKK